MKFYKILSRRPSLARRAHRRTKRRSLPKTAMGGCLQGLRNLRRTRIALILRGSLHLHLIYRLLSRVSCPLRQKTARFRGRIACSRRIFKYDASVLRSVLLHKLTSRRPFCRAEFNALQNFNLAQTVPKF